MPVTSSYDGVRRRTRGTRAAVLLVLAAVVGLFGSVGSAQRTNAAAPAAAAATGTTKQPNIVFVLTDDQRRETLTRMPRVQRLLVDKGTQFSHAMVPTALCCPSRATILTGLYAHHTKVYGNGDVGGRKMGGWSKFHAAGDEKRTIAVTLHAHGYRTALIGKYLNYFGTYAPKRYVPPGWDTFAAFMSSHGSYYNYRLSDSTRYYGTDPDDYSTDVLNAKAVRFVASTPRSRPLFLYYAPHAPHLPYTPAPRHVGAWKGQLGTYVARSYYQDPKHLPDWLAARPPAQQQDIQAMRDGQQESLMSVDESVAELVSVLRATGRLRNTLFVFTSDNGYLWGEHRMVGKDVPYDPATNVPLVMRWDGRIQARHTDRRLALNVDFASTLAEAAGTSMTTDGLSLLRPRTRAGFVLEAANGYNGRPAYCGWRTKDWMFVRYATGEREMFSYRSDPAEMHNLARQPSLRDKRRALAGHAKAACTPEPPHYDW